MTESSTSSIAVQALLRHAEQKLQAIDAISAGRLSEAHRLILDLLADSDAPILAGQCRYCGCTQQRGCAIAIPPDEISDAVVVRCSWWDDDQTVCSNLACVRRYERERGRVVGEHVADPASRIVRP